MSQKISAFLILILFLLLIYSLSGCDGGGGNDDNTGSGSVNTESANIQVSTSSIEVINRVLDILLGDDSETRRLNMESITRQQAVNVTLPCSIGEVSFNGDASVVRGGGVDNFSIDGAMNFNNCENIDGSISLDSSGTIDGNQITIGIILNGDLDTEECNIGFNQFSADTTANLSGIITSPVIGNGNIDATCDGESVACTLNNVNLEDKDAFEQSCMNR